MGEKKVYSVAIDGPAGAGKSTLAKQVAQNLGLCMWIPARFTVRWVIELWI